MANGDATPQNFVPAPVLRPADKKLSDLAPVLSYCQRAEAEYFERELAKAKDILGTTQSLIEERSKDTRTFVGQKGLDERAIDDGLKLLAIKQEKDIEFLKQLHQQAYETVFHQLER